jgi:molybdopterin-containing oxidoreductase family iron-sulfur binding subunit
MSLDRRHFLGLAGLSALAFAAKPSLDAVEVPASEQRAPAGTRWAMIVDPKQCLALDGCTRCIAACHIAHNVPSVGEARHEVKWIWKERFERAFPSEQNAYTEEALKGKLLPVLCNHCENPPCVRVCPTKATWKREDGIVMMDWHRCIGCRYCMGACPYGSRSFNWDDPRGHMGATPASTYPTRTKGVVEKCTFCEERLAKRQRPLCVEACPEAALVFGDLNDPKSRVRELLRTRHSIRRRPELGTQPAIYYLV